MGFRNRMLSSYEDAVRYATEARDAMAKDTPDCDEAVRATIDGIHALNCALAEWYDSTNPVPASEETARSVLRDLEWLGSEDGINGTCLICQGDEPNHEPDCALAKALRTEEER